MLTFVVPAFAVGVPTLYVLGRVYKEAYWERLQVPYTLMDYPVEDYLYWGFVALANGLFRLVSKLPLGPFGTWAIAIFGVALILAIAVSLRPWIAKGSRTAGRVIERKIRVWKAEDSAKIRFARLFLVTGQWINSVYLTFLLAVLVLSLSILGVSSAGKYEADRTRKRLQNMRPITAFEARAIVHLKNESVNQSGAILECAAQWCVISRRGQFVAVRLEDVARVDHCPRTIELRNGNFICAPGSSVVP